MARASDLALLVAALAVFSAMLLGRLGHPLFWSDEADTAMFGERVLAFGYPKVHGPDNVVYQFGPDIALGINESFDAYIGTTWGHFYFAAPGLWWAERTDDPYAKTARARLPFALAGAAGLGLWLAALLAAERAVAIERRRAPAVDLAPFAISALLVAPGLVFFETFHVAGAFARNLGLGAPAWAESALAIARHLLRHEMLAPALGCRALVAWSGCGSEVGRRVASRLLAFAAGYWLLGAANPMPLERYFVVLSPLLLGVFLLDAFALVEGLPPRWPRVPKRRATAIVAAALALGTAALRSPSLVELRGRVAELRTPVRGPLDFAIPYLLASTPHPEELVVATNYEEQAFMYYLGARTIIGTTLNDLLADRERVPHVVIPRRRWPRSLRELAPFLRRGEWEELRFPVRDVHWNQIPSLSRSRFVPDPHRFETPATDDPAAQIVIYWRRDSAKRTGTSSHP